MAEPAEQLSGPEMALNDEGRVHMVDATGAPVTVEEADVQQALQAGFGLEAASDVQQRQIQRERGTLGQKALTAGEGAVEAATLGLGTVAATGLLGDEYRQGAAERAMVNPGWRTAGQVVGSVAPVLASGGSGLAARGIAGVGAPARGVAALGGLAERGAARLLAGRSPILARAAAVGAAGATEGALMGFGTSIADAALQDTEWTADKGMAAMADGAWYGLAAGAGVGAGGALLSRAGKAALAKMTGGKSLREATQEFAETRAVKQVTGNNAGIYNELTNFGQNPERINRVGRKILDRDLPLSGGIDEAARAVDGQLDDAVGRMKGVAGELDQAGVKVDAQGVLGKVEDQIEKLRAVDLEDYHAVANKLESTIAPFRRAVEGPEGVSKVTRDAAGNRVRTAMPGKDYSFTDFWDLRKKLDDTIRWSSRQANPATDALKEMRRHFDDALTETVQQESAKAQQLLAQNAADPKQVANLVDLETRWKGAKEDFSDFKTIADGIDTERLRQQKNRFISPSDYGVAATGANLLGTLAGISTGSIGVGALTSMATGAAGALAHKFMRERGAGVLAKFADRISKMELRTTKAARMIAGLEKPSRLATRAATQADQAESRSERFQAAYQHVRQFTTDPEYASGHLHEMFAEVSTEQPEVAHKMMMGLSGDMAFLASKLPKPLTNGAKSFTPLKEKQTFTKVEQKRFLTLVDALSDPPSVAESLADGKMDLDAIEALKTRRPREYADLRIKVMTACAEREDSLPYARVNMLSLAFEFAGDVSHEPATLAAIQASAVAPPQGGGGRPSPQSDKKLTEAFAPTEGA